MQRHFTATAFIIDSLSRTLLIDHIRLGRWMPPGGHVLEDETPQEAVIRECKEETGLDVVIIGSPQENLFEGNPKEGRMLLKPMAMLLENIPANADREEQAHQHMDFLFVARPVDESQKIRSEKMEGIRWFTREEVEAIDSNTAIFSNVKASILSLLPPHHKKFHAK